MVRLIVVDADGRRAFDIGEGRLSVGSADEARLKLNASGVAGVHADIEVHGGKATLHPKPGVSAPQLLGRAASGPLVLRHGLPVTIGGAALTVEYEAVQARPGPATGAFVQVIAETRDEPSNERDPPRHPGLPIWVWIALGIPLIGGAGWFVMGKLLGGRARQLAEANASVQFQNALDRFENAQYPEALEELDRVPAGLQLDAQLSTQIAKLRLDIAKRIAESEEHLRNATLGTQYLDSQLRGFVERYMGGRIASPQARVFLRRARRFREQWPRHPERDWVERQEARFQAAIDLSKPPTFGDIEFEVEALTWSLPRNYREAFEVARSFQATASGIDVDNIAGLLAELELERNDWFAERLERVRLLSERKEAGESIGVLLSILRHAGDERMEDEAARQLLRFGDMQAWLRAYRTDDREGFEALAKNRVVAAFLKQHKL